MLCRAARGGLLSRNALCRGPSIAPTANIPQPGPNPQPRRPVAPLGLWRARRAGGGLGSLGGDWPMEPGPRAPGAAVRAAQQKCPNTPLEAATGEGRWRAGGFGAASVRRVPDFGPRRSSFVRGSEGSTSPLLHPRGKSPKQALSRALRVCNNAGSHRAYTLM